MNARFWKRWGGFFFILPWVVGFFLFTIGPLIASAHYSLLDWDMLAAPRNVGLQNYRDLFVNPDFTWSLWRTALYALMAVPVTMLGSLLVAMLLNQKVPGITIFRTVYYLPAVTSGVAMMILWKLLFRPDTGPVDWALTKTGVYGALMAHWIPGFTLHGGFHFQWFPLLDAQPGWLSSPDWALQTMVLLSVWGLGSGMIIYLAGLQGIPDHLYEAAELDGSGAWGKFINVTIPMLTPTIFFNLIMNTIGAFQAFDQAYILSSGLGGPSRSLLMYVLLAYNTAFKFLKIGPAAAMAWVLFFIILALTAINFYVGKKWVHYD
ncbi:MAG TPA: sugar ABC transporter permease [Armatimonadota bacterium]|jgi:multiple sugar transport system permease protein